MTIIDQYFSTCNDCGNRWESYVGVSTNMFGMTATEAESHMIPREKVPRAIGHFLATK